MVCRPLLLREREGLLSRPSHVDPAVEAGRLVRRLLAIADELGTGFDFPVLAQEILGQVEQAVPVRRVGVYAAYPGTATVPLALRGAPRPTWPVDDTPGSILRAAGDDGQPWSGRWPADAPAGLARVVAAVSLVTGAGDRVALIVCDRPEPAFTAEELSAIAAIAQAHAPLLDTSMVFGWLRSRSGVEERSRLSREIHNGVAQDLVALGFQVDALRLGGRLDAPVLARLDDVRTSITTILAGLRTRLAEMNVDARPDSSIGALLTGRLQVIGAYLGITVRTSLHEAGHRLEPHIEALLYRLAMDVVADATRTPGARTIHLDLDVGPAGGCLVIGHDGPGTLISRTGVSVRALVDLGVRVDVHRPTPEAGVEVRVVTDPSSLDGGAGRDTDVPPGAGRDGRIARAADRGSA